MREGSVVVLTGDRVTTGDVLGQVGLSGRTQFPHIHIAVRQDGVVVDPFTADDTIACDTSSDTTLWMDDIDTPTGGIIAMGFSDGIPDYDAVKAGTATAETLSRNAPIVVWAFAFGARVGDVVSLDIIGPDGTLFETDDVLTRQQARSVHPQ